jgi:capsular polysaccharide transport system permease protein
VEMPSASVLAEIAPPASWMTKLNKRVRKVNRLALVFVFIPTITASFYYGLIASDIYTSESRFVVRSPQRQTSTGLSAIFSGAGFSKSQDDSYSVHDFMLSRDALAKIDKQLGLAELYSSPNIDPVSRFGGFHKESSFEDLYRYYQKQVSLNLDATSSISMLKVTAFSAEEAYRINEMLLELGEVRINELNERGRQDMIHFASSEVAQAEKKVAAASLAVTNFRNQKSVYDPERQSAAQLQQMSKLQDEIIATKTQLAQILSFTPDNPQIPALRKKIDTLETISRTEMATVTGDEASLTNKATEYQRLALDREFAEKQLASALAALVQARNDADRKQLYLERIVQPNKPDIATEPRRLKAVLTTLGAGLLLWGIFSILIAGVREHHD